MHLRPIHGEGGSAVAADLQGILYCKRNVYLLTFS
jgi:hypothetical protein